MKIEACVTVAAVAVYGLLVFASGCAIAESCSDKTETEHSTMPDGAATDPTLLKPLPEEIQTSIRTNIGRLEKECPLSPGDQTRARELISGLNLRLPHKSESEVREIVRYGGAAIPVIETLLRSPDPELRRKAAWALSELAQSQREVMKRNSAIEGALLDLFWRLILDRDREVRGKGIDGLYRIGETRRNDIPERVKTGLDAASKDEPDDYLRWIARFDRAKLRLGPPPPRVPGDETIID